MIEGAHHTVFWVAVPEYADTVDAFEDFTVSVIKSLICEFVILGRVPVLEMETLLENVHWFSVLGNRWGVLSFMEPVLIGEFSRGFGEVFDTYFVITLAGQVGLCDRLHSGLVTCDNIVAASDTIVEHLFELLLVESVIKIVAR